MEGCLTDLGKTFAEKLINGAIQKSRYVLCFKCITKDFEEVQVSLEEDLKTIRQRVKVAIEKDKAIKFNVKAWENRANKLIQEDTKTKHTCFFGIFPDCISRYIRGEELTLRIQEIKELKKEGDKFENIELDRHLPGVERYSSQYYISFKSRELIYKELLEAIQYDSYYITGLHGMGGTGKTTLAKEVGKQLKTMGQFDHVIDTTVSSTPNIKKIQDDIAGSLGLQGLEWEQINESDRPKKLLRRLTDGQKILVILDDVWGVLDFDLIGIPKSDTHNECRVLVTTRDLWVCNQLECKKTIQLEILSEEDAWTMFKMHAGLSNNSPKSILAMGRKIATKCKRLPVAIATIANSLKGEVRQEEWEHALMSLEKPLSRGSVADDLVDIYKCLQFSYDNLKTEDAKGLFLLCSLFPEDEEISVETLTKIGKGVGLFGEDNVSYKYARSEAAVTKNKLIDSCLLLKEGKGEVKMHDLVREVAQWIAKKKIQTVNLNNKNQTSLVERDENVKYLLCEGHLMDFFSSRFNGSKLEILISIIDFYGPVDIPPLFFEDTAGLRVLFLTNNRHDGKINPPLPKSSIHLLTNLCYLLVRGFDLGDISVLGTLQSLETLELSSCKIDELPDEIACLERLKLLSLEECEITNNDPFQVIQRCSQLEELYFCCSFNSFCEKINLPALQRYHRYILTDCSNLMSYYSIPKCVSFVGYYFSEATLKYMMQTTEFLQLKTINEVWKNLIPSVGKGHGMNNLIELDLKYVSKLQCLIDTKHIDSQLTNVFSKLVLLKLVEMNNLKELCKGNISSGSLNNLEDMSIIECYYLRSVFKCSVNLRNLKKIKIKKCNDLVSIFDLSTSRSLQQLEKLKIINCCGLENIFTYDTKMDDTIEEISVDGDNDNNKSYNSMFPKLKVVKIRLCSELQFIFPLISAEDLLLLESISIKDCEKLEYIFNKHHDIKLASLKELQLEYLPNFIGIFPESDHSMPSTIKRSYDSISKPQTKLEPTKCNIFSWSHRYNLKATTTSTEMTSVSENQPQDYSMSMVSNSNYLARSHSRSISHMMCNTRYLKLEEVSKINSMFILSALIMSLETLIISDCGELKHIMVDSGDSKIVFPKLKKLEVENCVNLKNIFEIHSDDEDQKHNEVIHLHFPALECLKLCGLPSLISMCSRNYRTTLPTLTEVKLFECPQVAIKSIGDFSIPNYSISESRKISTKTIKQLSGNMKHFLTLKTLTVNKNSKVESIFCLNEVNEQQMNLGLEFIDLHFLPMMMCLFVAPKNSIALQNLTSIKIVQCEKLEVVFSTTIIRCLPQLSYIKIEECQELKHMIEDNLENKKMENVLSSKTFFPKLEKLVVGKCKKLKCIFPASMSKELHKLETLMIREADELEEIFKSEGDDDQKVEIPNMKLVAFLNLPSLSYAQGIQFQTVKYRYVENCQKLSLTSATTDDYIKDLEGLKYNEFESLKDLPIIFKRLNRTKYAPSSSSETENETSEAEDEATSGHILTSSQKLMNEQSMDEQIGQQHSLGEIDTTIKPSQVLTKKKETSQLKGLATSQKAVAATLSTISRTKNKPPVLFAPKQKLGIKISVEEGTTSNSKAKTVTSSTHLELLGSSSDPLVTSEHKISSQCLKETEDESIEEGSTSETRNNPPIQLVSDLNQKGTKLRFEDFDLEDSKETIQTANNQDFDLYLHMESAYQQFQESKRRNNGNENPNAQTTKEFAEWIEVQATILGHKLTTSQIKMKQTPKAEHKFVENVPDLAMPSIASLPTNSEKLMHEQSMDQRCLMNPQHSLGAIDTTINPSQQNNLEGSTAATMFTISGSKNEPPIQLVVAPKQKGLEISVEEGTTSIHDKNLTSSTHPEDEDGKIFIPSFTIVNTKPPATKDVDIGDSQETIALEDINHLIEEDPLLALEKLLTGQVSISSVRILLQELKTLMDSSSDLDHLVSNQESKSKLISLLHQLNQNQGMLTSDLKDFVDKLQNFFNNNIIKQATSEQVFKKHNQLLDSKTDYMNKLWSAKSTQAHIDSETSTANVQIDELSLQIDELRIKWEDLENQRDGLKSVVNKCDVQKKKLKAECTEWAEQSKDLISAIASSKVDVREAERARSLAKEGFANLKSLFPTF